MSVSLLLSDPCLLFQFFISCVTDSRSSALYLKKPGVVSVSLMGPHCHSGLSLRFLSLGHSRGTMRTGGTEGSNDTA